MRKNLVFAILTLLSFSACLPGCFTIDRATAPDGQKDHMLVGNYGWYLFHSVPLVCGNANLYPTLPFVFFRNDVTMDKIQTRFMKRARYLGKTKCSDLTYTTHESVLFEIPGLNFPLPIPYVLTYREVQLSGVIENDDEASAAKKEEESEEVK